MSIHVDCPGCNGPMSLPENLAGKKIRCKTCNTVMTVPTSNRWRQVENRVDPDPSVPPQAPRDSGVRSGPPPLHTSRDKEDEAPARKRPRRDEEERPVRKKKGGSKDVKKDVKLGLMIGGGVSGALALIVVLFLTLGRGRNAEDNVARLDPVEQKQDVLDPAPKEPVANPPPTKPAPKTPPAIPAVDPGKIVPPAPVAPPRVVGPLPGAIVPEMVRNVKQSTVFMRVTLPGGDGAEGSGFFAFQPGIVLTNAHVLGMLNADARRPRDVKVVVNSGERDERVFSGQILGVDRHSDLAVLRVPGNVGGLPPPLTVATAKDLTELQKVYIFGFPFGSKLGKNITVSESSISSIRKDEEGIIEKIQVNGGMHPGNSGGPVVDTRGHVVGVSVAGIRGTSINFAVPGEFVHVILDGRLSEFGIEPPFLEDGNLRSNVRMTCIDPLNRLKAARVEVWTGPMGQPRKTTSAPPVALPGDSPRQTFPMSIKNGEAFADVALPPLPGGQAYYIQPVLVTGSGTTKWAACMPYLPPPLPPFERRPIDLRQRYGVAQRTLFLKSSSKIKIPEEEETRALTFAMEMDLSEQVRFAGTSATASIGYLRARMGIDIDGIVPPRSARMQRALEGLTFVTQNITIDPTGNLKRSAADFGKVPPGLRDDAADLHDQVAESLETLTIPTPSKVVKPRETWTATRPLVLFNDGVPQIAQMEIVYTYDGCRTRDGKEEARISFVGIVKGRAGRESSYGGKVEGAALFDTAGGFISQARADVTFDLDIKIRAGAVPAVGALQVEMRRAPGLLVAKDVVRPSPGPGLPGMPGRPGTTPPLAKGRVVLQKSAQLAPSDFPDNVGRGRAKVFTMKMRKGKQYQIDVIAKGFDSMVRIETAAARVLGEDDDGGEGLNSRLLFRCPADGVYRIVVTSFGPNEFGLFQLIVKEAI